jgi:carbonic anhydrase
MPKSYRELLVGNQKWVEHTNKFDPHFFEHLAHGQHPQFLWIGCSDSRVPATEITHTLPGSIFVQRNIANMVVHSDANLLSVVYYAVKNLHVKHIIVCGHYGCGGIQAAMSNDRFGFLDNWLVHIKDVYRLHRDELNKIEDPQHREDRFVELNVQEQVNNLAMVSFIQEEWDTGEFPMIHGWVYNVADGLLKDLGITTNTCHHLDTVYHYCGHEKEDPNK